MSDRSDEALRERLELASYVTPGPWRQDEVIFRKKNFEPSYVVKDGYGRVIVDVLPVSAYQATARHIAASSPDVVRADLEEILELRAEVARLRARVRWLSKCAFKDTNRCAKLPGFSRCVWNCGEWCGAADDLRKGCWRDASRHGDAGKSGKLRGSPGEAWNELPRKVETLPDAQLDALEKLAGEATPGPWATCENSQELFARLPYDWFQIYAMIDGDMWVIMSANGNMVTPEERQLPATEKAVGMQNAPGQAGKNARYVAAANPAVVLALIHELRCSRRREQNRREKGEVTL